MEIPSNVGGSSPWSIKEYQVFPKILSLLHCVPLYVCRLCINYQDLSTNLLGVAALRMLLLTFISHFVIDFLSIRKGIIFSAIATDGRYPLRSRSSRSNGMPSKMKMESLRTFIFVGTVLRRGRMFQGSDEV